VRVRACALSRPGFHTEEFSPQFGYNLAYARTHPETAVPLERWYRLVKAANWTSMDDIRRASPKAKVLNRDRARFEIAGGNYRLIASFDFRRQIVFVKFIGTRAEYDAIDALTVARF
jgi:mRNA interferase HigB